MSPIQYSESRFPICILLIFLKFAYMLFLTPICVTYHSKEKRHVKVIRFYHQVLSAFLHVAVVISFVQENLMIIGSELMSLYHKISRLTILTAWLVYLISILYTFWFKQEAILDCLDGLHSLSSKLYQNDLLVPLRDGLFWSINSLLIGSISAISLAVVVTLIPNMASQRVHTKAGNLTVQSPYYVDTATFAWDIFVRGAYVWAHVLSIVGQGILIAISLATWLTALMFKKRLQTHLTSSVELIKVLDAFDDFGNYFESCANAFGLLYGEVCLAFIPTLVFQLFSLFGGNAQDIVQTNSNLLLLMSLLFFSAGAHAQLKSTKSWVRRSIPYSHQYVISDYNIHFRVNMLLERMNSNELGISGSLFTITYEFIGTVFGLIITYAIIHHQQDKEQH